MKKILPLICMLMVSFGAYAAKTPKRFRNPIFNNILWTENKNMAHDTRLTPTHIYDLQFSEFDDVCEYITEDVKGVLLKCHGVGSLFENSVFYEMYFIRDQYFDRKGRSTCMVWKCSFSEKGGVVDFDYGISSALLSSDIPCPDEKDHYQGRYTPPDPDCLEELLQRGWETYLPRKIEE